MKSYREAIRDALSLEMSRDESIVLIGEDLRGAHGCKNPQNL